MIRKKSFEFGEGIEIKLHNANLLLVIAKKGFIMCGYLDIETAERLGDTAGIVRGVSSLEDMLDARITNVTSKAHDLGLREGMTGKEALGLLT